MKPGISSSKNYRTEGRIHKIAKVGRFFKSSVRHPAHLSFRSAIIAFDKKIVQIPKIRRGGYLQSKLCTPDKLYVKSSKGFRFQVFEINPVSALKFTLRFLKLPPRMLRVFRGFSCLKLELLMKKFSMLPAQATAVKNFRFLKPSTAYISCFSCFSCFSWLKLVLKPSTAYISCFS